MVLIACPPLTMNVRNTLPRPLYAGGLTPSAWEGSAVGRYGHTATFAPDFPAQAGIYSRKRRFVRKLVVTEIVARNALRNAWQTHAR